MQSRCGQTRLLLCGLGLLVALAGCAADVPQGGAGGTAGTSDVAAPASGREAMNLRLARAARNAGDINGAVQLYRSLTDGRSPVPQACIELGDILADSGMFDEAIDVYGHVDPASALGLAAQLGALRAHFQLGEPAKALEFADRARALAPRDPRVLIDRGAVLDALQRHDEAQADYQAAIQIAPRNVAARNNLALSLAFVGKYDEALAIMVPLARSGSATPRVRQNLALIFGLSGDTDQATAMGRNDLDEPSAAANGDFYTWVRGNKPQ